MANLQDIRRRIKSVNNTAQITKAMQMVAASKMKKAQNQALSGRKYADKLNEVLLNLKSSSGELKHSYFKLNTESQKCLVLVISTDKGLCGGINTNLLKKLRKDFPADSDYVTVGKKLREQILKSKGKLIADFPVIDPVPFEEVKVVSRLLVDKFQSGEYSSVSVVFTNFISTLVQESHSLQLLPIDSEKLAEKREYEGVGKNRVQETDREKALKVEYTFEPDPEVVLNRLLPQYVIFQVYQMIVEARASEHSARMVAMKAATDNADDLTKDLKVEYNKHRQAAITQELLEITTAMKAME